MDDKRWKRPFTGFHSEEPELDGHWRTESGEDAFQGFQEGSLRRVDQALGDGFGGGLVRGDMNVDRGLNGLGYGRNGRGRLQESRAGRGGEIRQGGRERICGRQEIGSRWRWPQQRHGIDARIRGGHL